MRLRMMSVVACLTALPALAADVPCPRFQMLGWSGVGPINGANQLESFKDGPLIVTEQNVISAKLGMDANGRSSIALRLDGQGTAALAAHTKAHLYEPIALVIDGALVSAPRVQSTLTAGSVMLPGLDDYESAKSALSALTARDCQPQAGD